MSRRMRARFTAPRGRTWGCAEEEPPPASPASGALPLCCNLADTPIGPGYRLGDCQRCGRAVAVNSRVADGIQDAGLLVAVVCLGCWGLTDQIVLRAYRGK
jgi:hypothetical protein